MLLLCYSILLVCYIKVVLGHDHDDTLTSLNNVAKVYQKIGVVPYMRACTTLYIHYIRRGSAFMNYLHICMYPYMYACMYVGKFAQSEALFIECVEKRVSKYGPTHPLCTKTAASLAALRAEKGTVCYSIV